MQALWRTTLLALSLSGFAGNLAAESGGERPALDTEWRWRMEALAAKVFETSIDSGGQYQANRYFIQGGGSKALTRQWQLGASVGYGADHYNFSGAGGFGGLDPWDTVHEFRISMPLRYVARDDWSFFGIPSIRFNGESGSSFSDGATVGFLAGAAYRVNESLTIGPGFGVFSEIEDSTNFFPILLIDWRITDHWSLNTGPGLAASRGPGLQLRWQASPQWAFTLGGRYEKIRFRLDDNGSAPDGVGEVQSTPFFLQVQYMISPGVSISLIGGAEVGGEFRLEDSSGRLLDASEVSTAPFLGITFRARL
jgi:outer membrane receptor protein involved in Fe transport